MNCHELEEIVNDLARGQMMDASLREIALAHAESCGCCSMRLADERALSAGLKGLAAATAAHEAGPLVESALLKAFREQHSAKHPPVFRIARYSARRWAYVAVGAAAVAVIVMLLTLSASRSRISQPPVPEQAGGSSPALPPTQEDRLAPNEPPPSPAAGDQKVATVDRRRRHAKATPRLAGPVRPNPAVNKPDDSSVEIATEFIPLMNRDSLAQLDSGQVMRVELPRSVLMSFGLPMNMERANERIKADVIVGDDGMARAIRFIH